MRLGRRVILAMGMAVFTFFAGFPPSGECGDAGYDGLVSLRKNVIVTVGGEVLVDLYHRRSKTSVSEPGGRLRATDFMVRAANLRLAVDAHPNVKGIFKFNFDSNANPFGDDEIVEEALIVMTSVGVQGLDFFAGMGRAPYGQDVTLGMIQSYHHAGNRADSPEGGIFIVDPPADARAAPGTPGEGAALPPMRPGQLDRAVVTGAAYQWDERWRVELAMFRPDYSFYRPRLNERREHRGDPGADVGVAGRLWAMPIEDLTLEASAVWLRSKDMGRTRLRADLAGGAAGREDAFAVSLGFDWRRAPWMVFGEYQHGWDWNFSEGYDTDTAQLGMAGNFGSWRLGAMGEWLRIDGKRGGKVVDDYYKLCLNVRHEFSTGVFILAEYGHEWFRRERGGRLAEKRRGDFFGVRLGLKF